MLALFLAMLRCSSFRFITLRDTMMTVTLCNLFSISGANIGITRATMATFMSNTSGWNECQFPFNALLYSFNHIFDSIVSLLSLIFILLWLCSALSLSHFISLHSALSLSIQGGSGNQYSRNLTDHRWHHLRHWPRLLQTEELQRPHWHGVTHCHALLSGNCSLVFLMFNRQQVNVEVIVSFVQEYSECTYFQSSISHQKVEARSCAI